jgi:hypothetical protein
VFWFFVVALISLDIVVGAVADAHGDGTTWALLAIVVSPLLAGLLAFALSRRRWGR